MRRKRMPITMKMRMRMEMMGVTPCAKCAHVVDISTRSIAVSVLPATIAKIVTTV